MVNGLTQEKHMSVDWQPLKVVIFDVDGTLYTQSRLRRKMLFSLLSYYFLRPWRLNELLILHHFRAEREKRAGIHCPDMENVQYTWCAEKGNFSARKVKEVVQYWMFDFPLRYIADCVYPGTRELFDSLRRMDIKIAIYSDYPANDKLKAMGLKADLVVSSTDSAIDRLKPDPAGLFHIVRQMNVLPQDCLFIGDRPELDGVCAEQAGMPCLIVEKKPFDQFDFFHKLLSELKMPLAKSYLI
jgi:phosphoglycolate phosphatase/putative hydrolase of the HAD superfamily